MSTSKSDSRLRAWLQRVPSNATRLFVAWDNLDTLQTVAEWSKDEAAGTDAASLVLDAAQDHCDATEHPQRYVVAWTGDDGKPIATRPIKLEPEDTDEPALQPLGGGRAAEPNASGIVAQQLRHSENMHRMYFAALSGIMREAREQNRQQATEIAELRKRVRVAERAAIPVTESTADAEDSETMDRITDRAFLLLETYLKQRDAAPNGSNGSGHA